MVTPGNPADAESSHPVSATPEATTRTRASGEDPVVAFASLQPALAVAGFIAVLALIQVARAANGSVPTALAILEAQGPVAIVTGTTATSFASLSIVVAFYLWVAVRALQREGRRTDVASSVSVTFTFFALFLAPLAMIVVLAALWLLLPRALSLILRAFRKTFDTEPRILSWDFRSLVALVFALTVVNLAYISTWLPREHIETDDATVDGYVLSAEGSWTSVLVEDGRYILRLPSDSVVARTVCGYDENWATYSFTDLVGDLAGRRDPLPDCPTL